jgi:hypothetical protein
MKKIITTIALLAASSFSSAAVIEFNDFSDVSNLQINGDASASGGVLTLTNSLAFQSGSAFTSNSFSLNNQSSFSAFFSFQITSPGTFSDSDGPGADGLAFMIQTNNNTAGSAGGGIGYQGIGNSIAVELDTYNNSFHDDSSGNHLGINLGGNIDSIAQIHESTRFNNGSIWSVWVDYNGLNDLMSVRYSMGGTRPATSQLDYSVDLSSQLGSGDAFFGFTSGTGAGVGKHDILSAKFSTDFTPFDVDAELNESGTFGILAAGLAFLAFRRYKTKA